MLAITVDDERPMLTALTAAVSASPGIDAVAEFGSCTAAVDWVSDNPIDIAFLDINMRGMGGLALAERLIELCPDCSIIFCTGYAQYALDAIRLHVSGYLMKPITALSANRSEKCTRKISSAANNSTSSSVVIISA